jgi:hypothetical protein
MSVYRANIEAFLQAIESQPNLLSIQDWAELEKIKSDLPEDDDEEILEILENWLSLESRSQIRAAFENQRNNISSSSSLSSVTLGRNNSQSSASPDKPSESSKELLDNIIKKNSPLSDSQKPNPKP